MSLLRGKWKEGGSFVLCNITMAYGRLWITPPGRYTYLLRAFLSYSEPPSGSIGTQEGNGGSPLKAIQWIGACVHVGCLWLDYNMDEHYYKHLISYIVSPSAPNAHLALALLPPLLFSPSDPRETLRSQGDTVQHLTRESSEEHHPHA